MNPVKFVMRRPFATLMLIAAVAGGAVFGLNKMRAETYPEGKTPKVYVYLDRMNASTKQAREYIVAKYEAYFHAHKKEEHESEHKLVVTSPKAKAVTITTSYVCQIHSRAQTDISALEGGYLKEVLMAEGQAVKRGDSLFKIVSTLYQAELDTESAKALHAQVEYNATQKLFEKKVVSEREVSLLRAKLNEANAMANLAGAKLDFTNVRAPYDGIVDRQRMQLGSLVKEGDILTTLFDNSVMWVYFNVPEAQYLAYKSNLAKNKDIGRIELVLADHNKFPEAGKLNTIEAKFNNETGNISFRADFPNPEGLLRHGQTGTVIISTLVEDAIVIPQRATFENLAKRYVYVVGEDDVVHQREIAIRNELDDIFVVGKGVGVNDKIVLEGIRQVRDGEKVAYEFRAAEVVLAGMKNPAE